MIAICAKIRSFLCRIGLHRYKIIKGYRHAHVECRWCGKRDIWMNFFRGAGYQPADQTWLDPTAVKARVGMVPPPGVFGSCGSNPSNE